MPTTTAPREDAYAAPQRELLRRTETAAARYGLTVYEDDRFRPRRVWKGAMSLRVPVIIVNTGPLVRFVLGQRMNAPPGAWRLFCEQRSGKPIPDARNPVGAAFLETKTCGDIVYVDFEERDLSDTVIRELFSRLRTTELAAISGFQTQPPEWAAQPCT